MLEEATEEDEILAELEEEDEDYVADEDDADDEVESEPDSKVIIILLVGRVSGVDARRHLNSNLRTSDLMFVHGTMAPAPTPPLTHAIGP